MTVKFKIDAHVVVDGLMVTILQYKHVHEPREYL